MHIQSYCDSYDQILIDLLFNLNEFKSHTKLNDALILASKNGHPQVVERLLQDNRVDPSCYDNKAIRAASEYGHLQVVDRLLQDPRVDPSDYSNEAIRSATEYGYLQVVKRLFKHPKVKELLSPEAKDFFIDIL